MDNLASADVALREEIIKDIERARDKLARLPADINELESALGRPFAVTQSPEHPASLSYYRESENRFLLQFTRFGVGEWIYDSDNPAAGWIRNHD